MKFKLDENLGPRTAALIGESGHDVATVPQEKLSGSSDARLFESCITERRCLISLDLDFADVTRFPPCKTAGIAVLRLPPSASLRLLTTLVRGLLAALETASIAGRLWVVEVGRIRVHEEGESPQER
jgi:predicted nuclease of predicted toxin-antitoxin system